MGNSTQFPHIQLAIGYANGIAARQEVRHVLFDERVDAHAEACGAGAQCSQPFSAKADAEFRNRSSRRRHAYRIPPTTSPPGDVTR